MRWMLTLNKIIWFAMRNLVDHRQISVFGNQKQLWQPSKYYKFVLKLILTRQLKMIPYNILYILNNIISIQ